MTSGAANPAKVWPKVQPVNFGKEQRMTKVASPTNKGRKVVRQALPKMRMVAIDGKIDPEWFRRWHLQRLAELYPPELQNGGLQR
jgi:hypothetical protein